MGILATMRRTSAKHIAKQLWEFTKWIVGWPLAFFGIFGLPDQLGQWEGLIGKLAEWMRAVLTDPRVVYLAEKAVEIANFVNLAPIRAALAIAGIAILVWGTRPVWRLRHHLFAWWKGFLGEKVWIDKITAIALLKNSTWAILARMKAARPRETYNNAFAILL